MGLLLDFDKLILEEREEESGFPKLSGLRNLFQGIPTQMNIPMTTVRGAPDHGFKTLN